MSSSNKKPIKLTVVIGSLERGGTERHLLQVLPRIAQQGFLVDIYCLSHKGPLAGELGSKGVRVLGYNSRSNHALLRLFLILGSIFRLAAYLLWRRPHLTHFFLPAAYIIGAPVAILTGCRMRLMSRRSQNNYQLKLPWVNIVERRLHGYMHAVIGNSKRIVDQLREEGIDGDRLHLLYNGVDVSAFEARHSNPRNGANPARHGGSLVMVIVANLIPYKGHADLLDALKLSEKNLPRDWRLLCAGRDDGIEGSLRRKVREYGFEDNIRWLGSVADVPALLAAADIALLASHEEGFSNALIEYMAAGLPAIATDVGGNAEAVEHGETGLIVPAGNPQLLAEAIGRLANNPDLRESMGRNGRARVQDRYALSTCVQNYVELYRRLLGVPAA